MSNRRLLLLHLCHGFMIHVSMICVSMIRVGVIAGMQRLEVRSLIGRGNQFRPIGRFHVDLEILNVRGFNLRDFNFRLVL